MTIKEQEPPRVLSLSEAADRLQMKRSNVSKFLARRSVAPAFAKAQGYFYWESDIVRVKEEREADEERMAADERRRQSALNGTSEEREPVPEEIARLGQTQRDLLQVMLRRPCSPQSSAERQAMRRLAGRGLVEPVPGERAYQLTERARGLVAEL